MSGLRDVIHLSVFCIILSGNRDLDFNVSIHFELDLTYTEWIDDEVVYEYADYHEMPLEIGGIYSSVSFTCRPFRSRFDDPEFERRKINW